MNRFKEDSVVGLDILSLSHSLPSVTSTTADGTASWLQEYITNSTHHSTRFLSRLVIGAEKDFIVDSEGILESATYLGVSPVVLPNLYHDVMLGSKWKLTADFLFKWLQDSAVGPS